MNHMFLLREGRVGSFRYGRKWYVNTALASLHMINHLKWSHNTCEHAHSLLTLDIYEGIRRGS